MRKFIYALMALMAFYLHSFSQVHSVTGTVTNAKDGTTLPGVNIMIKGTYTGTATDPDGKYSINVTGKDDILSFSFIGYQTQEVQVDDKTVINVALEPVATYLSEVVIVGYGQLLKSQVVGAISKIKGSDISKEPFVTAAQGLQGEAPGIQVIGSGSPGSQPQVRIRGVTSITGDANPIYVVDGVITDDITNINTSDIQSVEVLKDASSQAIYGSRAGNGVIIITTKNGVAGKMKVNFDSYVGFRTMTSKVKMADAKTYAAFTNEARGYDNQPPLFDLDTLKYNTDWFKEVTRKGLMNNYNLSIDGGTEKMTYYFSAGYFVDNGIIKGNDYSRYVIRLKNDYNPLKWLELGYTLNLDIAKTNNKPDVFEDAYRMAPTAPVKYPNGDYGYLAALSVANPVAKLAYTNDITRQLRLQGNVFGVLTPVKGLTLRSSFNFDQHNDDNTNYSPEYYVWSGQQHAVSELTLTNDHQFYYIADNHINYHQTLAKLHEINVTVGFSAERDKSGFLEGYVKDVPDQSNLWYIDQGDLTTATSNSGGSLLTRESYYGRLTYTFHQRYSLSGSLRRDGSSNFPVGEKWGTFYSVGGTWLLTEENFLQNQNIFDELKIRLNYGKVGNDNVSGLAVLTGVTIQSFYYDFGGNAIQPVQAITFDQIKDATATWEPTTGVDAGIDFVILKNRLNGEISYYNKLTNAYVNVTVPSTVGDADQTVYSRAADVRNKGIEVGLHWSDKTPAAFSYYVGGNVTFNKNNVEHVNGNLQLKGGGLGNGEITTYTVVGQPIGSFWVYQVEGIYQNTGEIDATPHFTGAKPGDFRYKDVNGDGVLNDNDRIFAGSYQPKMYFAVNAGFNWKNIDFSVDCYGNVGNKIFNGKKAVRFGNDNIEESRAVNRWTPTNPNGTEPRASNSIPKPSTYFVESGTFFRFNNITLGYSIPTDKLPISKLRFYASAQNPLIFKKYSGFTPELPGDAISSGIELFIYPVTAAYLFGVNFSF
jgi:TonB-linked SusC/RagA family outer membrane protein